MSGPKWLMIFGAVLLAAGALWMAFERSTGLRLGQILGRLPGDIRIERDRFRFYFPLMTCLLLSAVISLLMWLLRRR